MNKKWNRIWSILMVMTLLVTSVPTGVLAEAGEALPAEAVVETVEATVEPELPAETAEEPTEEPEAAPAPEQPAEESADTGAEDPAAEDPADPEAEDPADPEAEDPAAPDAEDPVDDADAPELPDEGTEEPAETFVIEDGTLTAYNGTDADVVIPSSVTAIASSAFTVDNISGIKTITLSQNLSSLQLNSEALAVNPDILFYVYADSPVMAFMPELASAYGLTYETIGGSDEDPEPEEPFVIVEGVLSEYNGTDTVVTIPDEVTEIVASAFSGENAAAITHIALSPNTTHIQGLQGCTGLESIDLANAEYIAPDAFAGLEKLKSVTIPETMSVIGSGAFAGCTALESVTFDGCGTEETLLYVNESAFADCTALEKVTFKLNEDTEAIYVDIAEGAFAGCTALAEITIPKTVIVHGAFLGEESETLVYVYNDSVAQDVCVDRGYTYELIDPPALTAIVLTSAGAELDASLNVDLTVADSIDLDVAAKPAGANGAVTWKSGSTKIATVDEDGVVTIKTTGTVTITATSKEDTSLKDSVTLKIVRLVNNIEITGTDVLATGKSATLKAAVSPSNADNKGVTWSTSDASVATVSSKGVVKAAKGITEPTEVTIEAAAKDGSGVIGSHTIVIGPAATSVAIQYEGEDAGKTVGVDKDNEELTVQLSAITSPEGAGNSVTWKSSATKTATVDETGLVTFKKAGKVTITATAADGSGKKDTVTVNCAELVEEIEVTGSVTELRGGKSTTLKATVIAPEAPGSKSVTWSTSDSAVATVSSKGVVKGGKVTENTPVIITATAADGSRVSASYELLIVPAVTTVVITEGELDAGTIIGIDKDDTMEIQLGAFTEPADADQNVTWKSSSTKTATVDENGLVTFKKAGKVTITATAKDGTGKKDTITVNCANLVEEIEVTGSVTELRTGKSATLKATVTAPVDPGSKSVTWSTSDPAVATVSSKGVVKAGKVTENTPVIITATAADGSRVSASYELLIMPTVSSVVILNGAEDAGTIIGIDKDETMEIQLGAVTEPADAIQNVTWKSSSTKVATVDETGLVTFKKAGKVTITATAADGSGKKDTVTVNCANLIEQIEITGNTTVASGKSVTLKTSVAPSDATSKSVTWKSTDTSIATVSSKGVVKGAKGITEPAEVTIQAIAADGSGIVGECIVTVVPIVTKVVIMNGDVDAGSIVGVDKDGDMTLQLSAVTEPAEANQSVTWKSSSTKTATIDETGLITFKKAGKVTITATAADGSGKKDTVTVNCANLIEQIEITGSSSVASGKSVTLKTSVTPSDASSKSVTWKSTNTSVATVSSKGVVKGAKGITEPTEVTIQAIAKDGSGVIGEHVLTVCPAVTKVSITLDGKVVTGIVGIDVDSDDPTLDLGAITTPEGAGSDVTWSSSSTKVATVDANGVVKGLKAGKATITATAADGSGKKTSITVNVANLVEAVNIGGSTTELAVGKTLSLKGEVTPADATTKTLKWSSSDTAIATVSSTGVVSAKAAGEVIIYAAATDGSMIVCEYPLQICATSTGVTLYCDDAEITGVIQRDLTAKEYTVQLSAVVSPADASQLVKWSSSDTEIATVDQGTVTLHKVGTVTITATTRDGAAKQASVTINAVSLANSIEITGASAVASGKTVQLTAIVGPETAGNKAVTWASEDETIATVDQNGNVTGGTGLTENSTVTITATTQDGTELTATHEITVTPVALRIDLLENDAAVEGDILFDLSLNKNTTALQAEVYPADASQEVVWSSSDAEIVSVEDGVLTAHKPGTVVITAAATDGSGVTASVSAKVIYSVTGITVNGAATIIEGETLQLSAAIEPAEATDKRIEWSVDDDTIATIDQNGLLTATGESTGDVTVTAAALDGSEVFGTAVVTVLPKAESIVIEQLGEDVTGGELVLDFNDNVFTIEDVKASAEPAEALQEFDWTVSDETIAQISEPDESGAYTVTMLKEGVVTITATSKDGSGKSAAFSVHGHYSVTEMEITGAEEITAGVPAQLILTYGPENATYPEFTWTSSDETIATVDQNGVVTVAADLAAREEVTITAAYSKLGYEASAEITLTACPQPAKVIVDMPEWTADDNESVVLNADGETTVQLSATVEPADASQSVIWASSDATVATIDEDGLLTALTTGETTITATAANGLQFTIALTVKEAGSNITGVSEGFAYEIVDGAVQITGEGEIAEDGSLTIPEELKGLTVTAIAPDAFADNTEIVTVIVPDVIETIGARAFKGCTGLTYAQLSTGVTEIAEGTFMDCTALESVFMSENVTVIGKQAFKNCTALQSFEYPES